LVSDAGTRRHLWRLNLLGKHRGTLCQRYKKNKKAGKGGQHACVSGHGFYIFNEKDRPKRAKLGCVPSQFQLK
jgi:hypothetical protein